MSRSYRKPVYKDGGHWMKRKHARAMRRHVRQVMSKFSQHWPDGTYKEYVCLDEDGAEYWIETWIDKEPHIKHPYHITHPYDFCDWWFFAKDDPKAYRK